MLTREEKTTKKKVFIPNYYFVDDNKHKKHPKTC